MKDWQSQAHVRWDCKYHVVILPKYRRKVLYGRIRRGVGQILRDLCRQKDIELVEGKAMPDHIHMLLSVPPDVAASTADIEVSSRWFGPVLHSGRLIRGWKISALRPAPRLCTAR